MALTQYEDSDPLEDLSDEEIQQLMQLGVIPDEQAQLAGTISQAQAVRNRKSPTGTDSGRVYTAASPLEHAAFALQGIKAGKEMDVALKKQQENLLKQTDGRTAFLKALRRKPMRIEMDEFEPQMQMPTGNF